MHDFWRPVYGENSNVSDLRFRQQNEPALSGPCLGFTHHITVNAAADQKKLAITAEYIYKLRLDCFTDSGMVSVVFFLIIAYRPLIQSPLLNTAVRLAGEDYYRKA